MNDKAIIYKEDNGIVAVIVPTSEVLLDYTIMEVAVKDVPPGKPFKIINISDIPNVQDAPQSTWEVDDSFLNDGVGGTSSEFPKKKETYPFVQT